jgi:hypothetical protein
LISGPLKAARKTMNGKYIKVEVTVTREGYAISIKQQIPQPGSHVLDTQFDPR